MPRESKQTATAKPETTNLDAVLAANEALLDANAALTKQVQELTSMLSLVHLQQAQPKDSPLYRVENAKGVAMSFEVTDPVNGQKRAVSLERRNDFVKLYEEQIHEIQEKYPHFFGEGYLVAPDLIDANANTIVDIGAFLTELDRDHVEDRINAITAASTLYDIYNFIENLRYDYLDERGRPLTEKDNQGVDRPAIREKRIDPKLLAVLMAVQSRILLLSGVEAKVS